MIWFQLLMLDRTVRYAQRYQGLLNEVSAARTQLDFNGPVDVEATGPFSLVAASSAESFSIDSYSMPQTAPDHLQ